MTTITCLCIMTAFVVVWKAEDSLCMYLYKRRPAFHDWYGAVYNGAWGWGRYYKTLIQRTPLVRIAFGLRRVRQIGMIAAPTAFSIMMAQWR